MTDILVLPETSLLVFQVRPNAKLPSKQENFVKISARKQSEDWRVCFFFLTPGHKKADLQLEHFSVTWTFQVLSSYSL